MIIRTINYVGFDSESNYYFNDNEITPIDGKLDIADNWYGRDLTITRKQEMMNMLTATVNQFIYQHCL